MPQSSYPTFDLEGSWRRSPEEFLQLLLVLPDTQILWQWLHSNYLLLFEVKTCRSLKNLNFKSRKGVTYLGSVNSELREWCLCLKPEIGYIFGVISFTLQVFRVASGLVSLVEMWINVRFSTEVQQVAMNYDPISATHLYFQLEE